MQVRVKSNEGFGPLGFSTWSLGSDAITVLELGFGASELGFGEPGTVAVRVLQDVFELLVHLAVEEGSPFELGICIELAYELYDLRIEALDELVDVGDAAAIRALGGELVRYAAQRPHAGDQESSSTQLVQRLRGKQEERKKEKRSKNDHDDVMSKNG